jgi:hypothetical protein
MVQYLNRNYKVLYVDVCVSIHTYVPNFNPGFPQLIQTIDWGSMMYIDEWILKSTQLRWLFATFQRII